MRKEGCCRIGNSERVEKVIRQPGVKCWDAGVEWLRSAADVHKTYSQHHSNSLR